MKYISDALLILKSGNANAMRRAINNAAFDSLAANKNSLLGSQILAWHKFSEKQMKNALQADFHQRLPVLKDYQVDGILANFLAESRFQTALQGGAKQPFQKMSSGPGNIGLAQWLVIPRFKALLVQAAQYAAEKEQSPLILSHLHPVVQVETVIYELKNTHKRALNSLISAPDFETAVKAWTRDFEGISSQVEAQRGGTYSSVRRANAYKLL